VLPIAHIDVHFEGIRKFFYAGTPLSVEKGRRFQETSEGFYFTVAVQLCRIQGLAVDDEGMPN
jgi:hypothetical protein